MPRFFDTDQHVTPPKDMWTSRMPKKFADVAPKVVEMPDGSEAWSFDGGVDLHAFGLENVGSRDPKELSWATRYDQLDPAFYDAKARVKAMDQDGAAAALLFASVAGRGAATPDDELYEALFCTYNDGIRDWADEGDPNRMFPAAIIPCRGLEMATNELERTAAMGFKHFLGVLSPSGGRPSRADDPFWSLVQETGMVMSLHGGAVGGRFPGATAARPKSKMATPPVRDQVTIAAGRSGGMGVQVSLASFVFSGLLERFPNIKMALIETSAGWFPTFVERLDAAFLAHRDLLTNEPLAALPSEYLANVYMNFDRETEAITYRDQIGTDKLLFGTDYPHIGSYWPYSRYFLHVLLKELSEADVDGILWGNAARLYGVDSESIRQAA
jgi:predicted TIM-barrel fold metal-dependent hydrolase